MACTCAKLRKQNSKVSEMNIAKSCFILIVYCILGPCYSYTSDYCVSVFHARNCTCTPSSLQKYCVTSPGSCKIARHLTGSY